ncbi:hypothetical protein LY71_11328 [Geodermatophilus tzadiensis]|jgi:hypothetical protein|uniref:Uncharacterized protein n=2 Tax=Geodermatophilus TaxID=1860 RepID=A0A1I5JWY6_9ACTN|nr:MULTISPECIES: hypothetical protein [Geodermatophilus]PRY47527.1 hypothetical protein LY71_11328 [Geodermatophilus tzadiensis]SFO77013.1 hypothetical protein SAMN05660464_1083 [Geodermatophilus dictyosporus]
MELRRPIAALMTALALFGGGATLTACGDPAGTDRNDGTTDDSENTSGEDPSEESQDNLPDNSNPDPGAPEDQDDDTQDPD